MPPGWGVAGAGRSWPSTEPRASVTRGPLSCLLGQPSSGPATSTGLRSDPEWRQRPRSHWGRARLLQTPQPGQNPQTRWPLTLRAVKGHS